MHNFLFVWTRFSSVVSLYEAHKSGNGPQRLVVTLRINNINLIQNYFNHLCLQSYCARGLWCGLGYSYYDSKLRIQTKHSNQVQKNLKFQRSYYTFVYSHELSTLSSGEFISPLSLTIIIIETFRTTQIWISTAFEVLGNLRTGETVNCTRVFGT